MTVSPRTATAGGTSPPAAAFVCGSSTDGGDIRMYRMRRSNPARPPRSRAPSAPWRRPHAG